MGCYLTNFGEGAFDKVEILIEKYDAVPQLIPHYIDPNIKFGDLHLDNVNNEHGNKFITVCVVQNAAFDAAAVACTQEDFDRFNAPDPRHKTFLTMDLDIVSQIEKSVLEYIKEG